MLTTLSHHQRAKITRLKYAMQVQRNPESTFLSPAQLEERLSRTKPTNPRAAAARASKGDGLRWNPPPPASTLLHLQKRRPRSASSPSLQLIRDAIHQSSSSLILVRAEHSREWTPPVGRRDFFSLSPGGRSPDPIRAAARQGDFERSPRNSPHVVPWRSPAGQRIRRVYEQPSGLHLSQHGLPIAKDSRGAESHASGISECDSGVWIPAGRAAPGGEPGAFSSPRRDIFSLSAGRRYAELPPEPPPPLPPVDQRWVPAANAREPRVFELSTRFQPRPYAARLGAGFSAEDAKAVAAAEKAAGSEGTAGQNSSPGAKASGAAASQPPSWVPPGCGAAGSGAFSVSPVLVHSEAPRWVATPPREDILVHDKSWVPAAYAREPRDTELPTRFAPTPYAARLDANVSAEQAAAWAKEGGGRACSSSSSSSSPALSQPPRATESSPNRSAGKLGWVPPGASAGSMGAFSLSPGRSTVQ